MTDMMLACFLAAVETLNFTTAAEAVHITQPAFSRNIVHLEEEVGFPLFLRSKKNGLRVTPAGVEFYSGIMKLKAEYEALLDHAKRIDRGETGALVIGVVTGSCVESKTMSSIKRFQERYPNMNVRLQCYGVAHLIRAVEQGECDLCFMISSAVKGREELLSEDVFEIENYLFVPKNLMVKNRKAYSLLDFKDQTFILSEDVPGINSLLIGHCEAAGFTPRTIVAPDFETKMLWCEIGLGLSVNGEEHYMKNSPNIGIVRVPEIEPDAYAMIWHKNNYNPGIALLYTMFSEVMNS